MLVGVLATVLPQLRAFIPATLTPSSATASVGTLITWTPEIKGNTAGTLHYQYRVRVPGGAFRLIRDFGPEAPLTWTTLDEGVYEMEVWVKDPATGDSGAAVVPFEVTARVHDGGTPVVSATSHPLVFLYSAPSCGMTGRVRVFYREAGATNARFQSTPLQSCSLGHTVNFYIAALKPETAYTAQQLLDDPAATPSAPISFTTGAANISVPQQTVLRAPATPLPNGFLLQAALFGAKPFATDLEGNLLWYYPGSISLLTRPAPGGRFWGIVQAVGGGYVDQKIREFDLTGMTTRETNAAAINTQLATLGKHPISSFHHEVRSLSDGNIVVLAAVEQMMTDVQGPGEKDIIGDMILVLDRDLNVLWTWDSFDHLDVGRAATLGEDCTTAGSCPPLMLAQNGNDWTHGNSVQETTGGQLLLSMRHQDWVLKLDYRSGLGTGEVLWRLGKDGDFTYDSTDPYPWFAHQHDASFDPVTGIVAVMDNGNTRVAQRGGNSRGQVLHIDEATRHVQILRNTDLGAFSVALGSAQRLPNGNYHFNLGYVTPPGQTDPSATSIEINAAGETVYALSAATAEYRTFRLNDLYSGQ